MRSKRLDGGGHGAPFSVKTLLAVLAAAAVAAGCGVAAEDDPAPLDRFVFPIGLAWHEGRLLVVSSNFDLAYSESDGGSVLPVDPSAVPAAFGAGARIGSFGGEVVVPDAAACGLPAPRAFVASRFEDTVYALDLSGGGISCGAGCAFPAATTAVTDPYGLAVTCPPGGPARGWVGFLRAPSSQSWLGVFDLDDPAGTIQIFEVPTTTGNGTPRSFAYDAELDRLYFTSTNSATVASLRWIELGGGCTPGLDPIAGGCPTGVANLATFVNGAELTGVALGRVVAGAPRRMYVAARLFDANLAASIGARPGFDVGGVLLVLDLSAAPEGGPLVQLVRVLDVGLGASEVLVLPRPGRPDLVAVTASDDGLVWIYDDEDGVMKRVFSRDPVTGAALVGEEPFGLAASPAQDGVTRLYVGSFMDAWVTPIDVPLAAPESAALVMDPADPSQPRRIGQELP